MAERRAWSPAHPDDEVLGAGGTMAILAAAGARLRLIAVTDGEGSHPGEDPAVIGTVRTAESAAALDLLGVRDAEVIRLRLPDTGLAAHEDELAGLLRELCAGFEVCLAPWERDAHADHEAAGRAARRAAPRGRTVLSYPIWMWHWAIPADPRVPWRRACRVPLPAAVAARKRSAIGPSPASSPTAGRRGPGAAARDRGAFHAAGGAVAMTAPVTLEADYFDAMYEAAPTRGASRTAGMSSASTRSASRCSRTRGTARAFEPGCSIGVLTAMLAAALRPPAVV